MFTCAGAAAGPHIDGGKVDRTALKAWRDARREGLQWGRQPPPALVHLVDRSSQLSGADDVAATGVVPNQPIIAKWPSCFMHLTPACIRLDHRCWSIVLLFSPGALLFNKGCSAQSGGLVCL